MAVPVVPHDLEAEKAVLGAAMLSESSLRVVLTIPVDDFYRDAHAKIARAMASLAADSVGVDLITLKDRLQTAAMLDDVGGPAYLASLTDGIPRSVNVEHYAAIVRERARLRSIIAEAKAMTDLAYRAEPSQQIVADAVDYLMARIGTQAKVPVDIQTAAVEFTTGLDAGTSLLPTGYLDLDGLIGGLPIGGLTVIAARPSVGKTTMSLGIADRVAQRGRVVAYCSLEMRRSELGARVLSWRSRVESSSLERGLATDSQYARTLEAQQELAGVPLFVDETSTTLVEIDAWCRRLKQEHDDLACVVVDYLQLLMTTTKTSSRQEEVAAISRGLKRLAKEQHVAVLALSQLSRAPEARSDKRPHLADLRESGALEQDADIAILLFRAEMHKRTDENAGVAEFIVAKNRTGPVGVVRACFNEGLAQFDNLAEL